MVVLLKSQDSPNCFIHAVINTNKYITSLTLDLSSFVLPRLSSDNASETDEEGMASEYKIMQSFFKKLARKLKRIS